MGGEHCGNARAVRMWRLTAADRIEGAAVGAGNLGTSEIDAGIDHRYHHAIAAGQLMRLGQPQAGQCILGGIALARPTARCRTKR